MTAHMALKEDACIYTWQNGGVYVSSEDTEYSLFFFQVTAFGMTRKGENIKDNQLYSNCTPSVKDQ